MQNIHNDAPNRMDEYSVGSRNRQLIFFSQKLKPKTVIKQKISAKARSARQGISKTELIPKYQALRVLGDFHSEIKINKGIKASE